MEHRHQIGGSDPLPVLNVGLYRDILPPLVKTSSKFRDKVPEWVLLLPYIAIP